MPITVGTKVKTIDGSASGTAPAASVGTVVSINLSNTRRYGGVLKTFDEYQVQFNGTLQPLWNIVGAITQ